MSIHLRPDQEAHLREIAARSGRDPTQLVQEWVDSLLEREVEEIEAMRAAVAESRADYEAGHFTTHTAETTPQLLEELKREARDRVQFPD